MKAQRRAISRVLSQASGRSANSRRISSAPLNQCSGVTRRRSSWPRKAPSARQRSASWARRGAGKTRLVGGDQRRVVLVAVGHQARLGGGLAGEAMPLQLDIEPLAEDA